ncbi:MAG: AAA family ATPase [Desulfobulbia bacterium]
MLKTCPEKPIKGPKIEQKKTTRASSIILLLDDPKKHKDKFEMKPIHFTINGLFGRSEQVGIRLNEKVQIIYGVNGSGKTTVLKLLYSMLSGRLYEIRNIAFSTMILALDNGKSLVAELSEQKRPAKRGVDRKCFVITISLKGKTGKVEQSSEVDDEVELSERVPYHAIENEIPELSRVGSREWLDSITGDYLTLADVIEKYSNRLPWLQPSTEIGWYRKVIANFSVKLIQTQRLMTLKSEVSKNYGRRSVRYENTVIEYSEKLRMLIRDQLSESMQMAQSLDSTYPRRLLQGQANKRLSDDVLKGLLADTERLGEKLRTVDLLSKGDNVEIALESISDENRRAIALYLSDTIKKYETIEPFADKLLLFLEIVNGKFEPQKSVEIGGREGIRIGLRDGGTIHPGLLSSGEQHEIVLLFDLIFFSTPGTLVLIDEPEISLHIDWQKKFLSDVEAIGNAADLRFVLATHSPAIIGSRIDICEEI